MARAPLRDFHHVRLNVPDGIGHLATVELDGVPLRGVTAVAYVGVNDNATVTLTMFADLVIEGEAAIVQQWRQALPWWRRLPYWLHRRAV